MIASRVRVVLATLPILAVTACMSTGPAPVSTALPSVAVQARNTEWAQFMWQPGRMSCFVTTSKDGKARTRTTSQAQVVTSLSATDGMSYVVARTDDVTTWTPPNHTRLGTAHERMLYTITSDGAVEFVPQTTVEGQTTIRNTENFHYPAIDDTNFGQAVLQVVHARASSTDQTKANAFAYVTTDGTPEIAFEATYRYELTQPMTPVVTPAGTFSDVVALQATLVSVRVTNVSVPKVASAFEKSYRASEPSNTTWYARHVGPVMNVDSGPTGSVEKLVNCPTTLS
jgi:hypothetical protein